MTIDQETALVKHIDADPNWKSSQSGRRKIDYGPQVNFKERKIKTKNFKGLPTYTNESILLRLKNLHPVLNSFEPVEVNILEYEAGKGSNIDFHFDDFWMWGERIVGVSLLSHSIMTFRVPASVEVEV